MRLWALRRAQLPAPDPMPFVASTAPRGEMSDFDCAAAWNPVAEPPRVVPLDVLRGFAILGVLVANTLVFAYPGASSSPEVAGWKGTGPVDGLTLLLAGLLVEGKFFTLLSVLFGVGLALQAHRAGAAGRPFGSFHLRRAAILLGLGSCTASCCSRPKACITRRAGA